VSSKQNKNSWKMPLLVDVFLISLYVVIAVVLAQQPQSDQNDSILWFSGTAITSLCVAMIVLAIYRSSQLTDQAPGPLLRLFNRHAFFLILFFGSLAITGGFSIEASGTSIGIGVLLDLFRKSIRPKP
jgi:membrane-associated HD superfamily phosphohydrolase